MKTMRTITAIGLAIIVAEFTFLAVSCHRQTVKPPVYIEEPFVNDTVIEPPEHEARLPTIFFDFDRYDVKENMAYKLKDAAPTLMQFNGGWMVEGHTCPLGETPYNLALGWARANSVCKYLASLGVHEELLTPISYGEERIIESDSAYYWRNRRVVFAKKLGYNEIPIPEQKAKPCAL